VHAAEKRANARVVLLKAGLGFDCEHLLEVGLGQWHDVGVVDLREARPHREVHLVEVVVQDVVPLLVELVL
jgi:hypothetical protein